MKLRSRKFYATEPYRRILLCLLAVISLLKVKSPESMPNPDLASSGCRCGIRFKKSKAPKQHHTHKTATQIHAQLPSISLLNLEQSLYQASAIICQPLLRFFIIRHNALNLSPELLRMIHVQSMAKFMHHHIILHPLWSKHKQAVEI